MSVPKVAIIILNWNGWSDTIQCLKTLFATNYSNFDIVLLDNGSVNNSVCSIKDFFLKRKDLTYKAFEEYEDFCVNCYIRSQKFDKTSSTDACCNSYKQIVYFLESDENHGFAQGSNICMRYAIERLNPDYFLLLNNDVVVDKLFLSELVKTGEQHSNYGIVGPKIYYYDFNGKKNVIDFAGESIVLWKVEGIRYGFKELDNGQHENLREVDKIDGACMLIKRDVVEKIGLFDSSFFCYWEETDFCIRAKKEGYRLVYTPSAKIWHKIAMSSGGLFNSFRVYLMARNRLLFASKNLDNLTKLRFLLYFFSCSFWLNLTCFLHERKRLAEIPHFFKGTFEGLVALLQSF